jgi:hypothetical protein
MSKRCGRGWCAGKNSNGSLKLSDKSQKQSLDLALIGNGTVAALIDGTGQFAWGCFPRLDGDPVFCALLAGAEAGDFGVFAVDLLDTVRTEQHYLVNTPILVTRSYDAEGGAMRSRSPISRRGSGSTGGCSVQ